MSAEAGVAPQHAMTESSLGLVVGRLDAFVAGEGPQSRLDIEKIGAGGRGLGVGPLLSTPQMKAKERPPGLGLVLEVSAGQGAVTDPVSPSEQRVAGVQQPDPSGLAAPGSKLLEGALKMRPADISTFPG